MTAPAASQVQFAEMPHASHLPSEASDSVATAMADFDRDGDQDLAVLRSDGVTQIYRNDGSGRFDSLGFSPLVGGAGTFHDIAAGDVNRDGRPDLVVLVEDSSYGSRMQLYLNYGVGGFSNVSSSWMPTSPRPMSSIEIADFNRDGWRDIVAGGMGSASRERIYINRFGRFVEGEVSGGYTDTRAIAVGDVDGDGYRDLLAVGRRQPRLYLNDGSGGLVAAPESQFPQDGGGWDRSVVLADFDGDGDLDAVIGSRRYHRIYLNRDGVFFDATFLKMPVGNRGGESLALSDLDGDGDSDLVVSAGGGGGLDPVWAMINDGSAAFTTRRFQGLPRFVAMTGVAAGDVDGDGDEDLFVATRPPCDVCEAPGDWLLLNDGRGQMQPAVVERATRRNGIVDCLASGDVDGDGRIDLFVGARTGSWLMLGDDFGGFELAAEDRLPPPLGVVSEAVLRDFDQDGDADLLMAMESGSNVLLQNDGRGYFVDVSAGRMPKRIDASAAVAVADLDGDGDLDAVFANRGVPNVLYRYSAEQGFEDDSAVSLPVDIDDSRAVAFGDVDGDGDLDLVFGNVGWSNRLLINDGRGRFTDQSQARLRSIIADTVRVILFDADADGDLDLFFGNGERGNPVQDRLLFNDGKGVFIEVTGSHLPNRLCDTRAATVFDFDEDGDLDLFKASGFDEEQGSHLLENDGQGRFRDVSAESLGEAMRHALRGVQVVDVDHDGDRDLVVMAADCPDAYYCGAARTRVLLNLKRQIASPHLLRRGKEFVLEFYAERSGSPGHIALPWLSLRRAFRPVEFPRMGRLWLSSTAMVPLPLQHIDPETGRGELRFSVPNAPKLLGLPLYAQAAIVDLRTSQPKLSNLLKDIYSD